eukprot:gene24197-32624_t
MAPNKSKKGLIGVTVDWEMKFLAIAIVYAVAKLIGSNYLFLFLARLFFFLGNAAFLYYYLAAVQSIAKDNTTSNQEKQEAKKKCFVMLRSLFAKTAVVGAIHYRTSLVQPLLVSVLMGFFTYIENGNVYNVMYAQFPVIYDYFFL